MIGQDGVYGKVKAQQVANYTREEDEPKIDEYDHPPRQNTKAIKPLSYKRDF